MRGIGHDPVAFWILRANCSGRTTFLPTDLPIRPTSGPPVFTRHILPEQRHPVKEPGFAAPEMRQEKNFQKTISWTLHSYRRMTPGAVRFADKNGG